jgi:hypothetical protein
LILTIKRLLNVKGSNKALQSKKENWSREPQ